MLELFLPCLPGLEALLAAEAGAAGLGPLDVGAGGLTCRGDAAAVRTANLRLGLATHVLVRFATFRARGLAELRRKAAALPWRDWLRRDVPLAVRAHARRSRLYHTGAIEERLRQAIGDALGAAPAVAAPPRDPLADPVAVVFVRVRDDEVQLSIDTSGVPLHRRGWRLESGRAPLREDLARAVVHASGWAGHGPLVDPFAGSGTIAIEAALQQAGVAPGAGRRFAFEVLADHDAGAWTDARAAAREMPAAIDATVFAADRDAAAVAAIRANAERAGVAGRVVVVESAFGELAAGDAVPWDAAEGALVSNPPFGHRIGDRARLTRLHQAIGRRAATLSPAWRVALLVADRKLAYATGRRLRSAFLADHGGGKVWAMVDEVPAAGS